MNLTDYFLKHAVISIINIHVCLIKITDSCITRTFRYIYIWHFHSYKIVYQKKIFASMCIDLVTLALCTKKRSCCCLAARSLMGSEMASSSYYFDFLAKKETMQKMESSLYCCFLYLKKLTFFFWKKWQE